MAAAPAASHLSAVRRIAAAAAPRPAGFLPVGAAFSSPLAAAPAPLAAAGPPAPARTVSMEESGSSRSLVSPTAAPQSPRPSSRVSSLSPPSHFTCQMTRLHGHIQRIHHSPLHWNSLRSTLRFRGTASPLRSSRLHGQALFNPHADQCRAAQTSGLRHRFDLRHVHRAQSDRNGLLRLLDEVNGGPYRVRG